MDLFLAGCQGAGLALATGAFGGASGRRGAIGTVLMIAAVIGGAVLFGASLTEEDHPAYPGWLPGALLAAFAFWVVRDVVSGAIERAGAVGAIGAIVALAALVLAVLSLLVPPVAIVALLGLAYLAVRRRARDRRKYEGLRTLR